MFLPTKHGWINKSKIRKRGIGGVIRDHNGNWVVVLAKLLTHIHATPAELLAIFQELRLAKSGNIKPIELKTDPMSAISMITKSHLPYTNIIFECRSLMQQMGAIMEHVFRKKKE